MKILDDFNKIKRLDSKNLLESIRQLPLQLKQTYKDLGELELPLDYQKVDKIVANGMGGSRLGARVIERLFSDSLKVPLISIGSYELPNFVDQKTLLILSSYSGNTEEVLKTADEAIRRKSKILVFAQDGKLGKIAKEKKFPGYYNFSAKHNPCGQPRMGLGYQILGLIILLIKAGLINISPKLIYNLENFVEKIKKSYDVFVLENSNRAKILANQMKEKIVVFVGAEFIVGALHVFRNQINENAKQLAIYYELPELNHHLLEGLSFPSSNPKNLFFLFFKSDLYHPKNQARLLVTEKVLNKYNIKYYNFLLTGKNKIEQVFELIQFGSFVSFYLAILNKVDPSPIPMVDFFKQELEKI